MRTFLFVVKSLIAVGFCMVLVLALAEIGLRKKGVTPPIAATREPNQVVFHAPFFQPHPFLLVYNKTHMDLPNVHTNSKGFRGKKEYTKEKPKGFKRVVVLGGSSAVGFNASSDETTMPAQLELYLRSKLKTDKIEVINAACSGFQSNQDLILLATEITSYQPDLIVTFAGGTDLNSSMRAEWYPGYHELIEVFEKVQHHPWHEHSFALSKLRKMIFKEADWVKEPAVYRPEIADIYVGNTLKMAGIASASNIKFAAFLQPMLVISTKTLTASEAKYLKVDTHHSRLPYDYEKVTPKLYDDVRKSAARLQLPKGSHFVDASDLFAGQDFEAFSDAYHLTDEGYRFSAEYIGRFILSEKLLGTESPFCPT